MAKGIIGYSAKKKNKLGPILIVAALVLAGAVWYISSLEQVKEETVQEKTSVIRSETKIIKKSSQPIATEVLKKETCREIVNHLPARISKSFVPGEKAYFHTRVMIEKVPQTIKHVWVNPEGKTYASVDLYIVNQPADTWSYISLPPKSSGKWLVRVVVGGKIADELSFKVR